VEEKEIKEKKIQAITVIISLIFFLIGNLISNCNVILISILVLWMSNIAFSIINIKRDMLFCVFNIIFFILLLGKNVIYMFSGIEWYVNFSQEIKLETLSILYISLFSILLGNILYQIILIKVKNRKENNTCKRLESYFEIRKSFIQIITEYAFYITLIFAAIETLEKVIFVFNTSYLELYNSFNSKLPNIIFKIAETNFLFLAMYLATMPKKNKMFKVLLIYSAYLVLTLLIGSRGELIIQSIFIGIYLFYRQTKGEMYYSKKVIIILGILIVISLAFLSTYNLIRNSIKIENFNFFKQVRQFFIDQGASGDTLAYSVKYKKELNELNQNYTFGFFANYLKYGHISRIIGTYQEPSNDKTYIALNDNNLGASISYIVLGTRYLNGEGLGTQYLAELYVDYSYFGIIIYNIILGIVLSLFMNINYKNWAVYTLALFLMPKIIYIPRQFASDWLIFILSLTVYVQFIFVIGLSEILYRKKKEEEYEHKITLDS